MQKNHYKKLRKNCNIILTCEHASGRIPKEFGRLGLSKKEILGAKDLCDPGALEVLKILEKKLKASYLYSNISRLVVDYNRMIGGLNNSNNSFHAAVLKRDLMTETDGKEKIISIPLNCSYGKKDFVCEEKKRFEKFVAPYLDDAKKIVNKIRGFEKKYIIMIHSFFPTYNGDVRKVDIGVLYDQSKKISGDIIKNLRKNSTFKIGDNSPWKMTDIDGIFSKLEKEEDVEIICFDINNRNLRSKKDVVRVSNAIYRALKEVCF